MELTTKQKEFLSMLETQLGVVSITLNRLNINKEEYEGWLNNPTFKEQIKRVNELALDFVENKLLQKINDGDLNAIQFYLKTKGKKRGY